MSDPIHSPSSLDPQAETESQRGFAQQSFVDGGAASTISHPGTEPLGDPARAPEGVPGYEVMGELGHGGMGVVYKARQVKANRLVALKMIQGSRHAGVTERVRFQIEAEAIARLQHPHIVQLHEVGEHDGLPYFSLELCEGGSLAGKIKTQSLMPQEAAGLVQTLAQAIHYAHLRGVIHRDLKPANVLLTTEGTPKITDFGLAKQMDAASDVSQSGVIMGTPSYMAPEQAEGRVREIGPAADIYALGAILYELLTGQPPFRGPSTYETIQQLLTKEPAPPSGFRAGVPRDLETICLKCLRKNPEGRYASAEGLAEDLHRFQAGEPIQARPVGRVERTVKWVRRRPAIAALVGALAVVVVSAFALVSWQLGETRAALDNAEQQTQERDREQRKRALAQVNALRDAAPGAVPNILADLERNRVDVLPRLRELWAEGGDPSKRLRLALALLPVEPELVRAELVTRMLNVDDPAEVLLARDALLPLKADLKEPLWAKAEEAKVSEAERLRALAALAAFDPDSPRWSKTGPLAVEWMFRANPFYLASWTRALRPARDALLGPLGEVFRGRKLAEYQKVAATVLADFAADRPDVLAELLLDADEQQFVVLHPNIDRQRDLAVSAMLAEIGKQAAVVKDKLVFESKGKIARDDAKVKTQSGYLPAQRFEVRLQAGKNYRLTMDSQDFDCFLVLQDKGGTELAFDDDGGGDLNSLLVYTPARDDDYLVFAASYKGTGSFVLKIVETMGRDDGKETLAKRQANAAVALLKMGRSEEEAWPLLKHGPDPRVRSYLIHRLYPLGLDAGVIVERLDKDTTPDATIRRALLLSLGEYGEKLASDARKAVVEKVQGIYRTEADPGLHGSSEWLLRSWKEEAWLNQVNEEWGKEKEQREKRLEEIREVLAKEKEKTSPRWYVNGQGQTLVVIPGPLEFMMGSPPTEAGRRAFEPLHKKRIGRTFAIAAKSVTREQFLRFDAKFTHTEMRRYPAPTCPIGGVTWYEAAAYCNWLSKQEGIDKNQWCYETNPIGQVTKLKKDDLSLTGYRLPTEAEMEYSTRAGAVTARYYGETEELLGKYAWYRTNAQEQTWPVGSVKPNDFGLFDMHGNVYTWCQESFRNFRVGSGDKAAEDQEDASAFTRTDDCVLRGGSFFDPGSNVRAADRLTNVPTNRSNYSGLRPARTLSP